MGRHTFVSLLPSGREGKTLSLPRCSFHSPAGPPLRNPAHLQESRNQFFRKHIAQASANPRVESSLEEEKTVVYPTEFSFANRMGVNNPAKVGVENQLASGICVQ